MQQKEYKVWVVKNYAIPHTQKLQKEMPKELMEFLQNSAPCVGMSWKQLETSGLIYAPWEIADCMVLHLVERTKVFYDNCGSNANFSAIYSQEKAIN